MKEHWDSLPPELDALLAHERRELEPSPDIRERVWGQVVTAILPVVPQLPSASGPKLPPLHRLGGATVRQLLGGKLLPVLVSFGVGGGTGAALHAKLAPRPVLQAAPVGAPRVSPPAPNPAPSPLGAPTPPSSLPPWVMETRSHPDAPRRLEPTAEQKPAAKQKTVHEAPMAEPKPTKRDEELAAERALLDMAGTALRRGDPTAALKALDQHSRDFTEGALAEEREALRVQALAGLGCAPDAIEAAATFHQKFPKSLLWPAVRAAIQPSP